MKKSALSCAVIGVGVMGAAAAYALARRGVRVTVFEQFPLDHDRGSSHGATRLFRTAYFEHPDYVPLLRRAAKGWRALEEASGEKFLELTGVFLAGPDNSDLMAGTRAAAAMHDLPLEELSRPEAAARFSWATPAPQTTAMIEPLAGIVFADRARRAFINGARQLGAVFIEKAEVATVERRGAQIAVRAHGAQEKFDRLVVATGAFSAAFLGLEATLIQPVRKTLCWAAPGDRRFCLANGFIPFAVQEADGRFFYGFPAVDEDGVKFAEHTGGAPVPSAFDHAPEAGAAAKAEGEAFLRRFLPGLPAIVSRTQECLYAMSPDGHFIIDRHPQDNRIAFALGHSGHGFKFAPVIGEALADLTLAGETLREFEFLSLKRFR